MSTTTPPPGGWAVVELLGHRRRAGFVTEEELFGAKLLRIEIPTADGVMTTEHYGAAAIYGISWCSEEAARAVALHCQPAPVSPWEMPRALPAPSVGGITDAEVDDGEDADEPYPF